MELLNRLKHVLTDDWRNRVLYPEPLAFRYGPPLVDLVADDPLPALAHDAGIQGVLEHTRDRRGAPQPVIPRGVRIFVAESLAALVRRGIGHAEAVQALCDPRLAHALIKEPCKNIPYRLRRVLIDQKGVFILRVLAVAVGRKRADKLAIFSMKIPPCHLIYVRRTSADVL